MSQIINIIKSLPDLISLKPATKMSITDAELQLRVTFANDYKEYLSAFGAIMASGIELTGIAKAAHRNVVQVTLKERQLNSKIPHNMYVIEDTHVDGIVIWQDTNGNVYKSQPGTDLQIISDSLVDYISKHR